MRRVVGVLFGMAVGSRVVPAWAEEEARMTTRTAEAKQAAKEPEVAAPPRRVRDRNAGARLGFIVGGSAALAVFYGLPCAGEGGLWCVPFAGPVLVVARSERRHSANADEDEGGIVPPAFVYTLAGSLGALQLVGAALLTAGVLMPRREVPVGPASVTLLPLVGSTSAGVAATGTW